MTQSSPGDQEPVASRPDFDPGYGIDPGEEGLLPWSWALERLDRSRNYWVSTASNAGQPHAAPVWGVVVDGTLYFSTDTNSAKGRNLLANGRVVAHLESGDEVVILDGSVEQFQDGSKVPGLTDRYFEKYGFDVTTLPTPTSLWFAVRPRQAHGWREVDFQNSVTKWTFGDTE